MNPASSSRNKNPLAELPTQILLAGLATVLLSWPIIQIAGRGGAFSWAAYVFAIWVGMILMLVAIGRAISRQHALPTADQSPTPERSQKEGAA